MLLALAVSIWQTGGTNLPVNLAQKAGQGEFGGRIGYLMASQISTWLFTNLTRPISAAIIFIAIPLMLSMNLAEYFEFISKLLHRFLTKMQQFLSWLTKSSSSKLQNFVAEGPEPQMIADLRKDAVSLTDIPAPSIPKQEEEPLRQDNAYVPEDDTDKEEQILIHYELQYPDWKLPSTDLLKYHPKIKPAARNIQRNSTIIEQTLASFGINAKVVDVLIGPSVTQYAMNIALGTKVSRIANLKNDLALSLATSAESVRIEAPIPGTSFVGIEVPNSERQMISFRELAESEGMKKGYLTVTIGKNVSGENIFADIQKMPHLLIAGATGSGKSVVTNSFIMSMLMRKSPDEVRLILVDPKQVEFSDYNGIPHLLTPVITDMSKVNNALKWAIVEMERRYTLFNENKVRNIEGFNEKMGFHALPYILIVIDEMADMLMGNNGAELESSIVRLAQKARATGIHLILATQRPSVDVITGLIKANIPGRIGMSVTTQVDSRVILDQIGAEALLGYGDMLYKDPSKSRLARIQGCFISQDEIIKVVKFIKAQSPEVDYSTEVTKTQPDPSAPPDQQDSIQYSDDELFIAAARVVVSSRKGSSSLIQRKLSVGYNRAARLLDELEKHGIVGVAKGSKPRDVYVTDLDEFLKREAGAIQKNE